MIVIFVSVSKSIFERKKGIGFEIGEKNEKGYSRWSKEREIKNDKGIAVVNPLDQEHYENPSLIEYDNEHKNDENYVRNDKQNHLKK